MTDDPQRYLDPLVLAKVRSLELQARLLVAAARARPGFILDRGLGALPGRKRRWRCRRTGDGCLGRRVKLRHLHAGAERGCRRHQQKEA